MPVAFCRSTNRYLIGKGALDTSPQSSRSYQSSAGWRLRLAKPVQPAVCIEALRGSCNSFFSQAFRDRATWRLNPCVRLRSSLFFLLPPALRPALARSIILVVGVAVEAGLPRLPMVVAAVVLPHRRCLRQPRIFRRRRCQRHAFQRRARTLRLLAQRRILPQCHVILHRARPHGVLLYRTRPHEGRRKIELQGSTLPPRGLAPLHSTIIRRV